MDGRTDIYSLGVILYELLTGERPYQGDTAIKVIMQHIQSPVPQLPSSLKRYQGIIDYMMAKDRDKRIADADALLKEVGTYTGEAGEHGGDVQAPGGRGRAGTHTKEPWNSRKRLTTLGTCLVLVLAAMGVFYGYAVTLQEAAIVRRAPPQSTVEATSAPTTPAAAPTPARTAGPGSVSEDQVVRALAVLARKSLREDRLTQPPADNAHYYFSRLLALEPENEAAKRGFQEIAERFVVLGGKGIFPPKLCQGSVIHRPRTPGGSHQSGPDGSSVLHPEPGTLTHRHVPRSVQLLSATWHLRTDGLVALGLRDDRTPQ